MLPPQTTVALARLQGALAQPFVAPGTLDGLAEFYMLVIRSFAAARNAPSFLEHPRSWTWLLERVAKVERLPEVLDWLGAETSSVFLVTGVVPELPAAVRALNLAFGRGTRVSGALSGDDGALVVRLASAAPVSDILQVCFGAIAEGCTVLAVPDCPAARTAHCCFPFMLDEFARFHVESLGATRVAVPVAY